MLEAREAAALCAVSPAPSLGRDVLTRKHFQLLRAPRGAAGAARVPPVEEWGPELATTVGASLLLTLLHPNP